jgi:hypothetical protein
MPDAIPPVSPIVPEPAKPVPPAQPVPARPAPQPVNPVNPIIPPIRPNVPPNAPQHPNAPAGSALSIRIIPPDVQLAVGKTLQLKAEVRAGSAVTGDKVVWTSDNARSVEVSPAGLLSAKMPGTVIVRASVGKASGICLVTVTG